MPRRPRSDLTGFPLHLIQRGNNRLACFFSANDHVAYLHWLDRYARRLGVTLHAWVLMSNHVHLLAGERFRKEIEAARGMLLGPAPRGRPRKGGVGQDGEQLDLKL